MADNPTDGGEAPRRDVNGDAVLKELPEILCWLTALGVPAGNSRYARYDRIIDEFYRQHPSTRSDGGNQAFRDLFLAFRETVDILAIHRHFNGVEDAGFVKKLTHVVKGGDVPEHKAAGTSRDYLFELLMAARFHGAGYSIDFRERTDVIARRDGFTVRIECKRLSSSKKLRMRMDGAGDQLADAPPMEKEKVVGLICVDVSSCIADSVGWQASTRDVALAEVTHQLRAYLVESARTIEELNTKHLGVSLGTCFIATLPVLTLNGTLEAVTAMTVLASQLSSDQGFEDLNKVFVGLEGAFDDLVEPSKSQEGQ